MDSPVSPKDHWACAITFQTQSTTTPHQERKQLYLQQLVVVTPLLLSAAIVEEFEPV
jgi:hypothetical protein